MSDKFVYQNARVKSMEHSLFTVQSVARLLDCTSVDAAFRVLLDMGFGTGLSVDEGDFDALFNSEEERAAEFLNEFNVDGALNVFLAQYDFLNLKSVFKSSITGKEAFAAPKGMYDIDTLKSWISGDDLSGAPKQFAEAVTALKQLAAGGKISPHAVDCIVDKAMYDYIFANVKKSEKLMRVYFVKKADGVNLGAFLRCKRLGLDRAYFEEGFIEGGELSFLPEIYDLSTDVLKEKCTYTDYKDAATAVCDSGNLVAFEVEQDNALLKMWKDEKNDLFSVAPIVAYYLTRVTQIRVAKLAVAGIKNGVEQSKIKERLRELYA